MRLNSIHLVNFRQHADTRIDFDLGLTGIIGPNGSGKSTVLEAIAWALYGNPAARGTRDSIRFNRAGARAQVRVELDFELGGHRYRVLRGLTNAELFLDNGDQPVANSITGVTDLLRRRLGMSREEFFNTYFTGQKELSVMAAMGPSERAQFLSRVLGYERLRAAQNLVREQRRVIVAETAGLRAGMPDPEAAQRALADAEQRWVETRDLLRAAERQQSEAEARVRELAPKWERRQRERDELHTILSELKVAESEASAIGREVERIARELAETGTARQELETLRVELEPYPRIAAEFQVLENLCREEGRRQALAESIAALEEEIARLVERRNRLYTAPQLADEAAKQLETRRNALAELEETLQAQRTEWVRDRQEAETKRQALRQQYQELKDQRERLVSAGEEGICPTCTRPLGGHFRSVLDLLDSQLETVRVDGNYYKARLEQLHEEPEAVHALEEQRRGIAQEVGALERKLTKLEVAVQDLTTVSRDVGQKEHRLGSLRAELAKLPAGYDRLRHEALRKALDRLTPLDARFQRLSAQVEREPQLVRERDRAAAAEAANRERLTALRERRARVDFSEDRFTAARAEYERATAEARAAELATVTVKGDLRSVETARSSAETALRDVAKIQEKLTALSRDKRMHDELDRAYSDMRTDLNQALRPEISELASAFLAELTDARYSELELDDQYNIIVMEEGIPKPVISGGEEDLANLVLRLAISQMIAERAGHAFSLLVLDEIFGSLDEARRHNVVELLRRLHDRFEQVILITHIESVREGLDRVIAVRYNEETGSSTVRQGEPPFGGLPPLGREEPATLAEAAFE